MRVILQADHALKDVVLAGASSIKRMCTLFDELGIKVASAVDPPPEKGGPLLWVKGLFPLLDRPTLETFLAFGKRNDGGVFLTHEDQWGLLYMASPGTGSFRENAAALARFQMEAPALKPLAHAADLGPINREAHAREAARVTAAGAMLLCPEQTFIDEGVKIAPGALVAAGVTLSGRTEIGEGARIDTGSCLKDTVVGPRTHVKPYCVIEAANVGADAAIGPFAHVRPGSILANEVRIGNFVETKKIKMGRGSKASHLSYLGDAEIGEDCNIGAGTITCNYDGFNKSLTSLGDRVFIGSDSQLIAPVRVGDDGYVAAGSSVTDDIPAGALGIARARQVNKEHLAEKIRAKARLKKASQAK